MLFEIDKIFFCSTMFQARKDGVVHVGLFLTGQHGIVGKHGTRIEIVK